MMYIYSIIILAIGNKKQNKLETTNKMWTLEVIFGVSQFV